MRRWAANTFRAALDEHLAAIRARDPARFAATLAEGALTVDGKGVITRGTERVLAAHAAWFAMDAAWTFDYEIVATRERDGWGLALLHVTYRHSTGEQPTRFLLSLAFERGEDGVFRFAFDQNTPLG